MTGFNYALIPVLARAIVPDPGMAALIASLRGPHEAFLATEVGRTSTLLYRRDNFRGTLDDVICDALLSVRDAEIALSPGFRWGATLLPGQAITWEDIYNATAITYPASYRVSMKGEALKAILEDVADNLFNPDPYYQQGGDMVRVGGLAFTFDVAAPMGRRLSDLRLLRSGEALEATREYTVAGWASVNQDTSGPPIWDVVASYLSHNKVVGSARAPSVRLKGQE
jgi:S-sulfosulfanyl-L-cysteine sulfohydrolase